MANAEILGANLVEPFLPLLARAVLLTGPAGDPLFGDTDRGKTVGDVIAKAFPRVRVGWVSCVDSDRAVFVTLGNAGTNLLKRVATLLASLEQLVESAADHGK